MGRIYNFYEFIKESNGGILYILIKSFLISDLLNSGIYDIDEIHQWMTDFDFDEGAHAVFVSDKRTTGTQFDVPVSGVMRNNIYFRPTGKYSGTLIPDSDRVIDNNEVSLFVFDKKRKEELRKGARQIHGFKYEDEIKELNNLSEIGGKTDKWDAFGSLSQEFLDARINESFSVKYSSGENYISLVKKDNISGIDTLEIPDDFTIDRYWNIKTCSTNEINMADFKNISGLIYDGGKLVRKETVKEFILAVSKRVGSEIYEEYIVIIDADKWTKYLPDFSKKDVLDKVNSLYTELLQHSVKKESDTDEQKKAANLKWWEYVSKYSSLTKDSLIKVRFKRNHDQLRIQCAISWKNFSIILKENKHIKISKS